jgi:hypothetical protein
MANKYQHDTERFLRSQSKIYALRGNLQMERNYELCADDVKRLKAELAALKDAASRSLDDAYNSFGDREEAHERLTGVAKLVVKSWNTVELGALKDAIEDMAALVGEGF